MSHIDTHTHAHSSEEIRSSRRNSAGTLVTAGLTGSGTVRSSTEDPHSPTNSAISPKSGSVAMRRNSSIADEEIVRMRQLYSKLALALADRAKVNPGLKDPKRISFHDDDSTEISNILKAESQFVPSVSFNGEFTFTDAINEEIDCAIMDAIDNYGHNTFLPEDEEILLLLLREVSHKLHGTNGKSFTRRRGTKLSSLIQMDAALLEGYTSLKAQIVALQISHRPERTMSATKTISKPLSSTGAGSVESSTVQKWSYDPFIRSDAELMDAAFLMINEFGLIEKFSIDPSKLRNLISLARKNYRPNAFHNFYHAFGVMHLSFLILSRGAAEYLTPLEILAILVGALCHDLDHPGNNNAFEVASGSELANIYSDDAVLERYHIYMTHKLMKMPEADILSNLTPAQKTELRAIITSGIMATDMSRHFALTEKLVVCSKASPPFQVNDAASRAALVGFVIHCADIGAQTQKKELALKWGSRVLEEFQLQAANEAKLKIPTAPFMQGLDSEVARMKLQQGFVAGIVIPLWTALSDCLPKLRPCLDRAVLMKTHYENRVSELTEKPLSSPRGSTPVNPMSPRK